MNSNKLDSSLSDSDAVANLCTLDIDDERNRCLIDAIESSPDLWLIGEILTMLRADEAIGGEGPDFTGQPLGFNM